MGDRKQYIKEYNHERYKNNRQFREAVAGSRKVFVQKFREKHGVSYNTYRYRQLKQELAELRRQRNVS